MREGWRHPRKYFRQVFRQPRKYLRHFVRYPRRAVVGKSDAMPKRPEKNPTLPPDMFDDRPVTFYRTATGNYFLPTLAKNDGVAGIIKSGQLFEPEVIAVAKECIKPGTVVVDIGSNYGQMAVHFSTFTGPEGLVIGFEAQKYCHAILQKNITANGKENVRAIYGAVFDGSRKQVFFPEPDFERFPSYGSYPVQLDGSSVTSVDTLTVDELQIERPISFLKVDIQGSDLYALRGARATILRHRMPILFEFEQQFQAEFGTTFQDYVDFVQSIGYRFDKIIMGINYLVVPDEKRAMKVPALEISPERKDVITVVEPPFRRHLNKFLKNEGEVRECTAFLHRNGYVSHNLTCKDWDIAHIVPEIGDGNVIDMGSSDSYILKNISLKKRQGKMYGIDFKDPDVPLSEVTYLKGDLMKVDLPDQHLNYITCLSVIEHEVDFVKLAKEVNRLLAPGGRFYLTYDYWNPLLKIPVKLYDLKWQPLDRKLVEDFIAKCRAENLRLVDEVDWATQDQVIRYGYYSPHPEVAYTFGLLVFQKD